MAPTGFLLLLLLLLRAASPAPGRTPPKTSSRNAPPPPPPPPPPPKAETLLDHWRTAWLPLSGAAVLAGFLGFYIFGTTTASLRSSSSHPPSPPSSTCASRAAAPCEHSTPTGRPPALTGDNAEQFDKELNLPEWWMGVTSLRKRLAAAATGHVLEVAVGSGRNLEHYNWDALSAAVALAEQRSSSSNNENRYGGRIVRPPGITSFTGLDISIDMLDVARRKLAAAVPPLATSAPVVRAASFSPSPSSADTPPASSSASSSAAAAAARSQISFLDGHVRLIAADAHDPLPLPACADRYYDTVTQTFGLCSVRDPAAVLANLAAAVRPDTGRIILLEHGRGWYGLVNGLLDRNADKHFAKYGCWWNRDIEALVEEAARSTPGLQIVRVERPKVLQMGTLVWIELRVAAATG
ncbi:Methyltransferase OMS1 [Escovopsis weberi]|uniref:Methyltransferase OMS1 n=1 Tax=Escovopsis weberi TaxID=150374 RepID=A0A0M8MSB4_ESCWE|nr:Methyltransferase OMS1 [Escovopsis weberi]